MKNNQFGRTLIETLAILGVIGILTVSGLQLYAKAVNTIKVNHLMEKVYLLANQIRNDSIEFKRNNRKERKKAFDLPKVDETLSYGFSFDTGASGFSAGEIKVVVNGDFSVKICKILTKKLNVEDNRNGLLSIQGCEGSASSTSVTFFFDSNFKTPEPEVE